MTDFELPEGEAIVASYPSGYLKIWKILWAVDPARLKFIGENERTILGQTILQHQIAVSQALVDIHAADVAALRATQEQLGLK
jgi:hypothetical protein